MTDEQLKCPLCKQPLEVMLNGRAICHNTGAGQKASDGCLLWLENAQLHVETWQALTKAIADEREAKRQPIETCPDNTTVMFWNDGIRIGRMQHGQPRVGGFNQDHFWGGEFDDDNPPTRWQPLPLPPVHPPRRYR